MKLNFNFSILKDYLINFLNNANTPHQVYLRFGALSLVILVPCFLITVNRISSYRNYKNRSYQMLDTIMINRNKILNLATTTTEALEQAKISISKDVDFLSDIGRIADETDNEISHFRPLAKRIVTAGENIEVFPVEIKLIGSFTTLVNFLEQIRKYDRICTLDKIKVEISKLNYPYVESSFELSLFPFLNVESTDVTESLIIENDPFKPFYYEEGEISIKRKKGDIILTGIVKEKDFFAIIEIGGKGYIVKNGDSIGEIKITNITSDTVYLMKKEKQIKLRLEKNK